MPTRTYTGIDLVNYALNDGLAGTITPVISTPSQGNVSITGDGAGAGTGDIVESLGGTYFVSGDFDYDAFPAIPDNAQITRIRLKFASSFNGVASSSIDSGGAGSQASAAVSVATLHAIINDLEAVMPDVNELEQNTGATVSANASGSELVSNNNEVEILFPIPLTKAQLAAQYPSIIFGTELGFAVVGSIIGSGGGGTSSASADASFQLQNFVYSVDYDAGVPITLDPTGGDVESGQTIRVSGPNNILANASFAALQGDNVIPLLVQDDGDDKLITVPYPPTDDCINALAACPQCEECLDSCEENLDAPGCEECMNACLACLEAFFENLELAEECDESTRTPPAAVPIDIICSFPGFSGSVPLGNFIILLTNGSGIYQFQTGKTNDTLYSSARDGSTYDVKIPNPFGKTGFFRS